MHHKDIQRIVKKQLKKKCPNWKRMSRKEKKKLAKEVTMAALEEYDFSDEVEAPIEELVGVEDQVDTDGIISLKEMAKLIDNFYLNTFFGAEKPKKLGVNLTDPLLKYIDDILDDSILGELLWYEGFTPGKRDFLPTQFFRAELLKAIKYSEISYRKFCAKEYMGMERKENREFLGLPLHNKQMIDHTQLSQFRSSLSFAQVSNLLVYILHHVSRSGILDNCLIHGVDSTELANDNYHPLFSITVGEKKIRVYTDLDCDCGTRRNKRDKSIFFVGYRMHTLTAIDVKTGHSFPLASLIASGNHHDSLFLKPLIQLAQAMGIEMKLVTADEAYYDNDGSLFEESKVNLITPPSTNVKLPENVDLETLTVTCNDECEIPMRHLGCFDNHHEFKCGASIGECDRVESCPQYRLIPMDNGYFQGVLPKSELAEKAIDIRKNAERPFNLLKHREGLEKVRVRSKKALIAKCAFATIVNLLIEMERRCNNRDSDNPQLNFFELAS